MGSIRVSASGPSPQARAQAKGDLFERLMADVLRHHGYEIDRILNVNYSGLEIDIEGHQTVTGIPLYAECKCYETPVDAPKLQAFVGKFWTRHIKDARSHGLFIALPGINSHARGYYNDNFRENRNITMTLLEEDAILEAIFNAHLTVRPDAVARAVPDGFGKPGDWLLLYTDKGLFWAQYVIPKGAGVPRAVALFDTAAEPISEKDTIDYLTKLNPELEDFQLLDLVPAAQPGPVPGLAREIEREEDEVVEVQGSSAPFEYQFPASPQFFVGRGALFDEIDSYVDRVVQKATSSRGILFEANSGWGKSSLVLATIDRLRRAGHYALSLDSRSASSSQFVLRSVEYALRNALPQPNPRASDPIDGFEDANRILVETGRDLEKSAKVLVLFFDQFENVFLLSECLRRLRDLFMRVCDGETNVVLGFSWKTDLVGLTSDFPYLIRDTISASSHRITLQTFSEVETNELLDKLAVELHSKLRKDLRFFLSEFSQGYPWLLAKLCAHVKALRLAGVLQADIASNLLNVEQLFQDDLQGLSADEEDTLGRIAKAAPVSVSDFGEEFKHEVVQSLVNRRLLVRVGSKYDVYWDIFRDYLNTGNVLVQENYVLRMQPGSVLTATRLLANAGGSLPVNEFRRRAELGPQSFYNVARDMRMLALAVVEDGTVHLQVELPTDADQFEDAVRAYLAERLLRNRLVQRIRDHLENHGDLNLQRTAELLADSCPYISATKQTWHLYARIFCVWMDRADLAVYDTTDGILTRWEPDRQLRDRRSLLARGRPRTPMPTIQYGPIASVILRISEAYQKRTRIDWSGLAPTTRAKALLALEDLGFISRLKRTIRFDTKAIIDFAANPSARPEIFSERALRIEAFATFIELLRNQTEPDLSLSRLASAVRDQLGPNWSDGTAAVNTRIMLNWARNAGLAPRVPQPRKGRGRQPPRGQGSLWEAESPG